MLLTPSTRVCGVEGGRPGELGEEGVSVADDLRARLLRRGDDALRRLALRPRTFRDGESRIRTLRRHPLCPPPLRNGMWPCIVKRVARR